MASAEEPPLTVLIRLSKALTGNNKANVANEWTRLIEDASFELPSSAGVLNVKDAVQTYYEESIVEAETIVQYSSTSVKPSNISELVKILVGKWCSENSPGLHEQSRLEILTRDFYSPECIPSHLRVPLPGYSLGSFINLGTFVEHYQYYKICPPHDGVPPYGEGRMKADFEHDLKHMTLSFTKFESPNGWHMYKIFVNYDSIHSIVVDNQPSSDFAVYFILKHVPKVYRDKAKTNNSAAVRQTRELDNYKFQSHSFQRYVDNAIRDTMGRCNVLKLIFTVQQFWPIIGRIKRRANVNVYYLRVMSINGDEREQKSMALVSSIAPDMFGASFAIYYLVKALLSRGYVVLDQLDEIFIEVVVSKSYESAKVTEKALAQLLLAVVQRRYFSLTSTFLKLYEEYSSSAHNGQLLNGNGYATNAPNGHEDVNNNDDDLPPNCMKVRKLIVTPTRQLFMPPDVMMGNRVLRKFGAEFALRLAFRDEDGGKMWADEMLEKLVKEILRNGVVIGDRKYMFLAWSNSQLRDHGCYMYCKTDGTDDRPTGYEVADIREWMGKFSDFKNAPKLMSRMGQCFTQAQEAFAIDLQNAMVDCEEDVECSCIDPTLGKPYIFSDGIGRISSVASELIKQEINLQQTVAPCAYQIRCAGYKGMLSVDNRLNVNEEGARHIIFRKSMLKFTSVKSNVLEIVKHSQPCLVYLNRPLIMILDQVSEKQFVHRKVKNAVHQLLENRLYNLAKMMLDGRESVNIILSRTPLENDLLKAKIEVPDNQGRTMFGIMDEYHSLQNGQIFIQYSTDMQKPGEKLKIMEGPVMVTKNPCHAPGDVRIYQAVKINRLKHLFDVIVFPCNGPRPHTDEMSGSDLDGDEYSVFWDKKLMFTKSEEPMHFPKMQPDDKVEGLKESDMIDFFSEYIRNDRVGQMSTAHLVYTDRPNHSLFDCVSTALAEKVSLAVDFPKTGKPPTRLSEDEECYLYPDYLEKEDKPTYKSQRLLGELYRKIKSVVDTISLSQADMVATTAYDQFLEVEGWQQYVEVAQQLYNDYVRHLQHMLDHYGIQNEAQLISGHTVSIRNRISDREKEDFSGFTTEKIMEMRLVRVVEKFRRKFFQRLDVVDDEDCVRNLDVQRKASACYIVTYMDEGGESSEVKMLSFPWLICGDVLTYVKKLNWTPDIDVYEPIHKKLNDAINNFCNRPCAQKDKSDFLDDVQHSLPALTLYLTAYGDVLGNVVYCLLRWCELEEVYHSRGLFPAHLAALFLDFAARDCEHLRPQTDVLEAMEHNQIDNTFKLVRPGAALLEFIKYLSSEEFKRRDCVELPTIDKLRKEFRANEWHYLNSVAFKTYHHIAYSGTVKSLHLEDEDVSPRGQKNWDIEELNPVIRIDMQFNPRITLEIFKTLLKKWSKMDQIQIRKANEWSNSTQYIISGSGCLEARNELRKILLSDQLEDALYAAPEIFPDLD